MSDTHSKEASSTTSSPAWFGQGHIRDDVSKDMETHILQGSFLYTRKNPVVGMHVVAEIHPKNNGLPFTVVGNVTVIGELPILDASSNSLVWEIMSDPSLCWDSRAQKMEKILWYFGTVHGQQVKARGYSTTFSSPKNEVELVVQFDDNLFYPWKVVSFRALSPSAEKEFQEFVQLGIQDPNLEQGIDI